MNEVIQLTQDLIGKDSITPNDKGCQKLLAELLHNAGFIIEHKRFGKVDNLFAWHGEETGKSLMFLGHTDVVPTGNTDGWKHNPFAAIIDDGLLYGRGSADMKSAVAAFTLAMIDYVKKQPKHAGKISLMLTSDEEGVATDGIKKMMPYIAQNHDFDYCIVGEPSSCEHVGDVVRIGRRGSLHVKITIHGKQGHVAYPENASNPVFLAAKFIGELNNFQWDTGSNNFPPTSLQISSVKTSSNTSNIIPADFIIQANFRYNPQSDEVSLKQQLQKLLEQNNLTYSITWSLSGKPFYSQNKFLQDAVSNSIFNITNYKPLFNTAGGTSDGRFVAPLGIDVVELGVGNETIHQANENVAIADVIILQRIYTKIISTLLS